MNSRFGLLLRGYTIILDLPNVFNNLLIKGFRRGLLYIQPRSLQLLPKCHGWDEIRQPIADS